MSRRAWKWLFLALSALISLFDLYTDLLVQLRMDAVDAALREVDESENFRGPKDQVLGVWHPWSFANSTALTCDNIDGVSTKLVQVLPCDPQASRTFLGYDVSFFSAQTNICVKTNVPATSAACSGNCTDNSEIDRIYTEALERASWVTDLYESGRCIIDRGSLTERGTVCYGFEKDSQLSNNLPAAHLIFLIISTEAMVLGFAVRTWRMFRGSIANVETAAIWMALVMVMIEDMPQVYITTLFYTGAYVDKLACSSNYRYSFAQEALAGSFSVAMVMTVPASAWYYYFKGDKGLSRPERKQRAIAVSVLSFALFWVQIVLVVITYVWRNANDPVASILLGIPGMLTFPIGAYLTIRYLLRGKMCWKHLPRNISVDDDDDADGGATDDAKQSGANKPDGDSEAGAGLVQPPLQPGEEQQQDLSPVTAEDPVDVVSPLSDPGDADQEIPLV